MASNSLKAELDKLVEEIKKIRARHVILGTVPHVTIAPFARGVDTKVREGSRYFPYYTLPWINNKDFDPKKHSHLTEQEARAIDSAIDQYNEYIVDAVRQARKEGKDWYVFEAGGLLDRFASRRYIKDPSARPSWWTPYQLPPEINALSPVPDSRFLLLILRDVNWRIVLIGWHSSHNNWLWNHGPRIYQNYAACRCQVLSKRWQN